MKLFVENFHNHNFLLSCKINEEIDRYKLILSLSNFKKYEELSTNFFDNFMHNSTKKKKERKRNEEEGQKYKETKKRAT